MKVTDLKPINPKKSNEVKKIKDSENTKFKNYTPYENFKSDEDEKIKFLCAIANELSKSNKELSELNKNIKKLFSQR